MVSKFFYLVVLPAMFLPAASGAWRSLPQNGAIVGQNRTAGGDRGSVLKHRSSSQQRLIGDFPEYRPGGREAGKETFWR